MKYFLAIALTGALILSLAACSSKSPEDPFGEEGSEGKDIGEIKELEVFTLSENGTMAYSTEYEILKTEEGAMLSKYEGSWNYDDSNREAWLVSRIEGGEDFYQEMIKLLQDNSVSKWNGYSKYAKHVLDGYGFHASGKLNGINIYASGSNATPEGYRTLSEALYKMLNEQGENPNRFVLIEFGTEESKQKLYGVLPKTETSDAFLELLKDGPLTLDLKEYGGFEKIGELPEALPTADVQTDAVPGDILLYQGKEISLFYGENSWSYTRLGWIRGAYMYRLPELFGEGDLTVTISITEDPMIPAV